MRWLFTIDLVCCTHSSQVGPSVCGQGRPLKCSILKQIQVGQNYTVKQFWPWASRDSTKVFPAHNTSRCWTFYKMAIPEARVFTDKYSCLSARGPSNPLPLQKRICSPVLHHMCKMCSSWRYREIGPKRGVAPSTRSWIP